MPRKYDVERPYAPDYVSADTLAYRLDLSRSTLDHRVGRGELPKPCIIAGLQRWCWAEVQDFIKARNTLANAPPAEASSEDEYLKGIARVETAHT